VTSPPENDDSATRDWFKHAFNDLYPVIYAHRSVAAAKPEARFAAKTLGVTAEHAVLDLCCGDGRHLVHLKDFTARLTGLDYSPALLRIAKNRAGAVALVRADMRAVPFRAAFDVVVSFFTSFGYFETLQENRDVVRNVANALKPGGKFLIDYLNPVHVASALVPESSRNAGAFQIQERRWISQTPWRIHKHTQVFTENRLIDESQESVQLYSPTDFVELLKSGGLTVTQLLGDFTGAPLDETRPRLIAIGSRSST